MGMIGNAPVAGTIGTGNIQDGGVETADLANGAVTAAKLASTAVTDKLGYTPLNKAGDTMTSGLTKNLATGLGTTAGDYAIFDTLNQYDGTNQEYLYVMDYRNSNGTSWTTASSRIQKKVDSTWMGYVEFNGDNSGGVTIGAGAQNAGPNGSGMKKGVVVLPGGQVLQPNQPRFSIAGSGGTYAGGAVLKMAGSEYDPLSLYDPTTGLFTAPCAGYYHFSGTVRLASVPTFGQYFRARFMKNGAHIEFIVGDAIVGTYINGMSYASWNMSINLSLAQGDAISLAVDWNSGPTSIVLDNSGWSGFLVA